MKIRLAKTVNPVTFLKNIIISQHALKSVLKSIKISLTNATLKHTGLQITVGALNCILVVFMGCHIKNDMLFLNSVFSFSNYEFEKYMHGYTWKLITAILRLISN